MAILKDGELMGAYDVLAVWAGCDAMEWFERQGFSADRILNSRYEQLLERWEVANLYPLRTCPVQHF